MERTSCRSMQKRFFIKPIYWLNKINVTRKSFSCSLICSSFCNHSPVLSSIFIALNTMPRVEQDLLEHLWATSDLLLSVELCCLICGLVCVFIIFLILPWFCRVPLGFLSLCFINTGPCRQFRNTDSLKPIVTYCRNWDYNLPYNTILISQCVLRYSLDNCIYFIKKYWKKLMIFSS